MAQRSEATLHLVDGMHFVARTQTGHDVHLDANPDVGGTEAGPRPMEMVLVALGGCGAMDVVSILRKMRQDVSVYDVRVSGERAAEHPRVYTRITIEHRLSGRRLAEANVRRAIELSMTRYCPVLAMLHPKVAITSAYEIRDEMTGAHVAGVVAIEPAAAPPPA